MYDKENKSFGIGIGIGTPVKFWVWRLTHTIDGNYSEQVAESGAYFLKESCERAAVEEMNALIAERTTGLPKEGTSTLVRNITYEPNCIVMTESLVHPNEPNITFVKNVWRWRIVEVKKTVLQVGLL